MRLRTGDYVFGRVVGDAVPLFGYSALLLYVYNTVSASPSPPLDAMSPARLLFPPVLTNRLGWRRGYFETVATVPLCEDMVLSQHCFAELAGSPPKYYDAEGAELPQRLDPCGDWALSSFETISMRIETALVGTFREPIGEA